MKKLLIITLTIIMSLMLITACAPSAQEQPTNDVGSQLVIELCVLGVRAAFCVLFTVVTAKVIPLLERWGLLQTVKTLVRSAEKKGETGAIAKANKRIYVEKCLQALGIELTPLIDNMIEAAVEEIDAFGKKLLETE